MTFFVYSHFTRGICEEQRLFLTFGRYRIRDNGNLVCKEALVSSRSGPERNGIENLERKDSCN